MTRLLVPIDVAALIERSPGEVYARTALAPADRTVNRPTRQRITPPPFTDAGPRTTGVRLLWAPPDALARFDRDLNRFPRLPCRWVVVRTSAGGQPGDPRAVRAWVIGDIHQTPVPVTPLPGSIPGTGGPADLDITGPDKADPRWFSCYDNVENRLGFFDDLSDGPTGPLNYLVCGWYVRTENDPIRRGGATGSEAALRERLTVLGWGIDGTMTSVPTGSLFHGAAAAIGWPGPNWPGDGGGSVYAETDERPDVQDVRVGVGERLASVLGELLTDANPAAAALVEFLVGGEIGELTHPSGEQRAARDAHRDRFGVATPPDRTHEIVFVPQSLADPNAAPAQPPGPQGNGHPLAAAAAAADPGELDNVQRPDPRSYRPLPPEIVLEGAGRTYRHGEDARFDLLGRLPCRLSGDTVTRLGAPNPGGAPNPDDGIGADTLARTANGALDLPTASLGTELAAEVAALLVEVQALDPAVNPGRGGPGGADPLAQLRVDWLHALARAALPGADPGDPPPDVTTDGKPPAPAAFGLAVREWNPVLLDWELQYAVSEHGLHDWTLEDVDFEPATAPSVATPTAVQGRALLASTPARSLADAIERAVATLTAQGETDVLDEVVAAFGAVDVDDLVFRFGHADLVGTRFEGFLDRLRGVPEGTWISRGGIIGSESVLRTAERGEQYPATSLVGGTWTIGRLRLVDGFGRTLDLLPSDGGAGAAVLIAGDTEHPGAAGVALQRPRFTAPATIEFRYVDPIADGPDLSRSDVSAGRTPLVGFLTPNPFDGSLELHDVGGLPLGQVAIGGGGRAVWSESPGVQDVAGLPPTAAIGQATRPQRTLAAIVTGILTADANRPGTDPSGSALTDLLGALDAARFTIDPSAGSGDQHLQALLGNPVALVRARVRLTVEDPQARPGQRVSVPVHLGSIGEVRDGLLGFYLGTDPSRLHLVHPALAAGGPGPAPAAGTPDASGVVWADQDADLDLLLLMTPGADVTLTSGLMPGKVLTMQREWFDAPLARIAPTLRFDAVLRELPAVRLPVSADIHGHWDWHHRDAPDAWTSEPVLPTVPGQLDPARVVVLQDGYLRMTLDPEQPYVGVPYQVTRIKRFGKANTIQRIEVLSPSGKLTQIGIDDGVQMVDSGRFHLFTEVAGFPRADVIVDVSDKGRRFLRTDADQTTGNNLGSLPTF